MLLQLIFWLSLGLLAWTFAIYPALVILIAGRSFQRTRASSYRPRVTVVMVCYNEAARLPKRIDNLLNTDYPHELLDIVLVSDGSSDDTEDVVQQIGDPRLRLIARSERTGKAGCLNVGVEKAKGEIIVFCDARQTFNRQTIPRLIDRFPRDGKRMPIGAVSGRLEIAEGGGGMAEGVGAYWKLERRLREAEGMLDSTIGCTGAVYAVRRELYRPIPDDTLLDDVVIPMQILCDGSRVVLEPYAHAFDPQELSSDREENRKRRTLAGNVQMLLRHPQWLLPWRNRCLIQLISHKYMRMAGPFCLLAAAVTNVLLLSHRFYLLLGIVQLLCYVLALIGARGGPRPARLAASFLFLNLQVVRGIYYYFFGNWRSGWK